MATREESLVERSVDDAVEVNPSSSIVEAEAAEPSAEKRGCWCNFHGVKEAKGYAYLGTARGAAVMSNIFLATSLIYLASEQAGCVDEEGKVIDECDNTVYGFRPPSLIANIAVISGLLSAFLMPLIGAIVDYTPHRRLAGIVAAFVMTLIQAVQIGTVSSTWFAMLILQAIVGFIYQIEVLATYAYLPEIARTVGEKLMTRFTSTFVMIQFTAQGLFLIVVIALSFGFGLDDVVTAQVSQAINTVWIAVGFALGWRLLPNVPARHGLPKDHSIWTEGFKQTWRTAKTIHKHYPRGLRWFLLATVFAEAGANAFTVVSVVFLDDHLKMSGSEVGIVFLISLIATIPGAKVGSVITKRTNPNSSWKLSMAAFAVVTFAGSFALQPELSYLAYVWGAMWGFMLGWFYSTENLFFSLVLPKGSEAELTGFFVYCTQMLVWLPPLLFSTMIEAGVNPQWGLMTLVVFFVVAICILFLVAPWDQVLEESTKTLDSKVEVEGESTDGVDDVL